MGVLCRFPGYAKGFLGGEIVTTGQRMRPGAPAPGSDERKDGTAAPDRAGPRDPGRMAGYGALLGGYSAVTAVVIFALRRRKLQVSELRPLELVTYGLATQHLARLLTKDTITSIVRSPFTRFEEPAGEGEVNEKVVGTGPRHAIGELLTCPFCLGQWVATALVAARVIAPSLTTAVVSVSAVARLADYLQLFYGLAREAQ